tara:strand:- start:105 stop:239 length:135 start_codon:yes stop_codon:yes gene_type:complete
MDIKEIEKAILIFKEKIKNQGLIVNARDEQHLENLQEIYKELTN